ncbi:MAG: HD domain-containing protein [Acidobacteriota bacterium]|nr:HD domain-containing protein [Acidobacteriota bacterium]
MRFQTRVFLLSFVPFAALLTGSFWIIQRVVQSTVRDGLRTSIRENHLAIARVRAKSDLQNNRFLQVAGENAALKAGMGLLLSEPGRDDARLTVEDQLRDLCERMGFDFLLVSAPNGSPLAGVLRANGQLAPVDVAGLPSVGKGLVLLDGRAYQIASVPLDQEDENIGTLSVGERFDLSEFTTPAVLIHKGTVLKSNIAGISAPEVEAALRACRGRADCDVRLRGATYLSVSMPSISPGTGYLVRSLQNVDSASAPVRAVLKTAFGTVLIIAVLLALVFSIGSSRSIVKPLIEVISQLRTTDRTGLLPEFATVSPVREIRDLTTNFNRAAASIREAREDVQQAYIESVGSLATALDARDQYTAGHSRRVSDLSCATAHAMGLNADCIERIRVGAVLHDIGKIGIPDAVLQKPGKLTEEEYAVVKRHPEIGRRILEGVNGFASYLDAVELHHENWDGTGYPWGQTGEQTPIEARIIHLSDAYDAMTSDRPYRRGMTHERAVAVLRANAGTMFDPRIVLEFARITGLGSGTGESLPADECAMAAVI